MSSRARSLTQSPAAKLGCRRSIVRAPRTSRKQKRSAQASVCKLPVDRLQSMGSLAQEIRLGLCCLFKKEPIKFRQATAGYVKTLDDPLAYLSNLVLINSDSLVKAIDYCRLNGVGCFRLTSRFFPLFTFPELGYKLTELPDYNAIAENLNRSKLMKQKYDVRLVMHPDQFVVLNSPNTSIVKKSIEELEYHQLLAEMVGVDVINIHAGGAYGDKKSALERFAANFRGLSAGLKSTLTIENDDKTYTPEDLLPVCRQLGIPLVYDVHHHRCKPDGLSIEEATNEALKTWNREPLLHISSPLEGWNGPKPFRHHDYIDNADFPEYWKELGRVTIEVEAKAKELAVHRLSSDLQEKGLHLWKQPENEI